MTPTDLAAYLKAMKDANVASARVVIGSNEISVVFGPEALPAGEETTPGGWKGPERLDDHSTFEVPLETLP